MNMSPACEAPVQPSPRETDRNHPRYPEYERWMAAMRRQMVVGNTFDNWLAQTERTERLEQPRTSIFQFQGAHPHAGKWGRIDYGHKHRILRGPLGPFNSEAEAAAA
ncbi:hypothetical protein [Ramlibacter alkalitolerans]|uniref:Uncharacterized protein n=1 Tax=Ramlibacter alkalitolerans TaxID=2039631 RepID=A0ABS1JUQ1_9BURK|nr:hypothetical protein [Ramlibacter alkalitolerans]MBL0427856.1 hypothetical protein [Ramlibacter alkalitolerans]